MSAQHFSFLAFSDILGIFSGLFWDFLWTSSRLWSLSLIFTDSPPLCQVSLVVTMSVRPGRCLSVPSKCSFFFEASHWPSDHMISSRPLIGSTPWGLEQAMVSAVLALVLCIGASIRTRQESKCPLYAGFSNLFYQPVCQAVFQCKFTARLNQPQLQHTCFK